jgi:hypothetical protein
MPQRLQKIAAGSECPWVAGIQCDGAIVIRNCLDEITRGGVRCGPVQKRRRFSGIEGDGAVEI